MSQLTQTQLPAAVEAPESVSSTRPSLLRDFYELTKPRMNFLVVLTTLVGFILASPSIDWLLLFHTVLGTALTAAGASVLNQFSERQWDGMMLRTARRPLPAARVSPGAALVFGIALGVVGVIYLALAVNTTTAALGWVTLLLYVFVYTPMKRTSSFCTVVGAIPGAIPPVMGFTAATGVLPQQAWALFLILFVWQMPHFLAIAMLFRDDYLRAGFRMLPCIEDDFSLTRRQIVLYSAALLPVSLLPVSLEIAGRVYLLSATALGAAFMVMAIRCALAGGDRRRARELFLASIIYLPLLLLMMVIDKL